MEVLENDPRVIWAAGFFDGEGCISFSRGEGIVVCVTQRMREPLLVLEDLFGGAVYAQGNAGVHQWRANGISVKQEALRQMLPFLIVKRSQAELALEYLEMVKPVARNYTTEQKARRGAIVVELAALKKAV